ncbi:MAG TPA: DUF1593 domain-containing protein [Bacteroidales bacterium]|nr:DUF1593 domain-containing protein [Bacteroidales bacterium]
MKAIRISFFYLSLFLLAGSNFVQAAEKHRMIVLSDIEADPDDSQTLVRLLLYSNQIDIKGLIATTSIHQQKKVVPETMHRIIDAYGKVQPNLLKHEAGYPSVAELHRKVKKGLPVFGMLGVGEGKDSEGSDWIIQELEMEDERPLWISVWGGPNTLAQALWKIRETKSKTEAKRLISKLKVYTISDQDDTGIWMRKNFPDLFYIVSTGSYGNATWSAINTVVKGINNETISNDWIAQNIQQGHGALGAEYPDVAYGMEGDTPSWLMLILNGLNDDAIPNWGSWGGRYELYIPEPIKGTIPKVFLGGAEYEPESRPIWTNTDDTFTPRISNSYGRAIRKDTLTVTDNKVTLWRWRDDFQNDFAARMDWCTKEYAEANHPPVPALGTSDEFTVKSGDVFSLDASGTTDPDGDNLSYWWFQYPEVGSYGKDIGFAIAENLYLVHTIVAPEVETPVTTHFILKVTDKGTPALSRYKRVIVTILPKD